MANFLHGYEMLKFVYYFDSRQCDQIRQFFALWATIQSWWQQLFYPNRPHCQTVFVKVSKSFIS